MMEFIPGLARAEAAWLCQAHDNVTRSGPGACLSGLLACRLGNGPMSSRRKRTMLPMVTSSPPKVAFTG